MKKFFKGISALILVAVISAGGTYATYTYLESRSRGGSVDIFEPFRGQVDAKNVHLASLTPEGYPDFTKVAENSVNAVVNIKSTVKQNNSRQQSQPRMIDPFEYFFGFGDRGGYEMQPQQPTVGFGSGVIVSKDGYIITNNHVVDKATEIEVTLNDNQKFSATLVGADPNTDIALIKIEGNDFPIIPFGNSDALKVGEWVLAIGNPFNLTSTVTAGIVSAKARGGIGGGTESIQSFIQTDAAINPGNSGGALVNTDGELVGINTAIYSQTGNFAGYGFAVPISIAGKVIADLKEYGTVQRAVLGIVITDVSVAKERYPEKTKGIKTTEGIYVDSFADRSPAKEAGMEAGDVIIEINGVKVRSTGELQEQVSKHRPGDKVDATVMRNNEKKTYSVTLKNRDGNTTIVKKTDGISAIGASFKELSPEAKRKYGVSFGVEVTGVDPDGKFSKEGLSKGFIILKADNQPVSTPAEIEKIIQAVSQREDKGLFISGFYPNGRTQYFAIDLGNE